MDMNLEENLKRHRKRTSGRIWWCMRSTWWNLECRARLQCGSAEIVGKSQEKCKKQSVRENDRFWPVLGTWLTMSCENKRPWFDIFPNVSCVFAFSHAIITMCPTSCVHPFCSVFLFFWTHAHTQQQHSKQRTSPPHHTTPHTVHAFLCVNPPNAMKPKRNETWMLGYVHLQATVILRVVWARASAFTLCVVLCVVCVCVFWNLRGFRQCGGKAIRVYQEKANDLNVLFWTCSQTLNGHDPVVTVGEFVVQVMTPRGPFLVSGKMAMKNEPNIRLRWSRTVHFCLFSQWKMRGPILWNSVSPDRTFSKTNAPTLKKHPVCVCVLNAWAHTSYDLKYCERRVTSPLSHPFLLYTPKQQQQHKHHTQPNTTHRTLHTHRTTPHHTTPHKDTTTTPHSHTSTNTTSTLTTQRPQRDRGKERMREKMKEKVRDEMKERMKERMREHRRWSWRPRQFVEHIQLSSQNSWNKYFGNAL